MYFFVVFGMEKVCSVVTNTTMGDDAGENSSFHKQVYDPSSHIYLTT